MDVSGIFYFSAQGRERGSRRQKGGEGGRILMEGGLPGEGEEGGPRGREGVCGELGGGGVHFCFVRGRNSH